MAGVRQQFFKKEAEGAHLQARRRPLHCARTTWPACPLLPCLPSGRTAWGLHRQEANEGMGGVPERSYGCPSPRRRGRPRSSRSHPATWRPRATILRPSGKAEEETGRCQRKGCRRRRRDCAGPESWRPCATKYLERRRRHEKWRILGGPSGQGSAGGSSPAEGGASGDLIGGGENQEGSFEEEKRRDPAASRHRAEAEECSTRQEIEGKQQQEELLGEKEEKEKEEEKCKDKQLQQWYNIIEQLYGNAASASKEEQAAARICLGDVDEPRDRSFGRLSSLRRRIRSTPSAGNRKADELLSDTCEAPTDGKNTRPSGAGDDCQSSRHLDGWRSRRDGRHPGGKVHSNRNSGDQWKLGHCPTFGSGSKPHTRSGPGPAIALCSAPPTAGRKGFRTRLMARRKAARRMVVREQRRCRRTGSSRKRKRQIREEQEQRQEGKEVSVERCRKAEGKRRRTSNMRAAMRITAPSLKAAEKICMMPAPDLKAAGAFSGAGSPRRAAVRKTLRSETLRREEPESKEEEVSEVSRMRKEEEELVLHEETEAQMMLPASLSEARDFGEEKKVTELLRDFESFKEFAEELVESLMMGRNDGALAPFAKLLAPIGANQPSCARHGPRWGLFPLPVDLKGGLHQSQKDPEGCGATAWVQLCAMSLNRLAGVKDRAPVRRESKQVQRVLAGLEERVKRFLRCSGRMKPEGEKLWSEIKTRKLSYDGEEISQPHELTFDQIQQSVPPKGHGGCVALAPLLCGRARFLLEHPESCLLAIEDREEGASSAKVHIKAGDEIRVWRLLEERGVIRWLDVEKVFRDAGGSCSAGMFGVPKTGKFTASGECVLRVIMNLKPLNRLLTIIRGDIGDLPTAMTWTQLVIAEDEIVEVSQADMSSAFYLFSLPPCWLPFMSFACSFERSQVGLPGRGRVTPSCTVLPMGWASSVGLMQMASRELLLQAQGDWQGELRRTSLSPPWFVQESLRRGRESWWQVYLDNFMAAEVKERSETGGDESLRLHSQAVAAWEEKGVLCAKDKHVLGGRDAVELGVCIQGEEGWLGGSTERFHKLISITMSLLKLKSPRPRWVQVVLGRWIFVLQYRRPAMAVLSNCWNYMKKTEEGGGLSCNRKWLSWFA